MTNLQELADQLLAETTQQAATFYKLDQATVHQHVADGSELVRVRTPQQMGPLFSGHDSPTAESFVLVAPGEPVQNGTDRVVLRDLIEARVNQLASAANLGAGANRGRMSEEGNATAKETQARAQESRAQRLRSIAEDRPRLAALTAGAIAHMRLPEDHLQVISEAVQSGDQRLQAEMYVLRRFVEGPTGQVEVAYSLHRWTADAPRPKRWALQEAAKCSENATST